MKGQDTVHVGLNAHLLSRHAGYRSAGIHSYITQLIQHLPLADPLFRFTVFAGHSRPGLDGLDWRTSRLPTERPWGRIAWEQLIQPWTLRQARVDLLHALAFVSPLTSSIPTVITIHDLSFLRFPECFRPANRLYLSMMTRLSCRRAKRIIAVSQATAEETTRLLGVPTGRIDVVPHGVEHAHFRPIPSRHVETFRREKGLPDRFVLFVGTLEPRKNLLALIEAFSHVAATQAGVKLVIVGGKGWYYQQVFERVQALDLTHRVMFAGFVSAEELPLWYNAAAVFVYPSVYEGFGMPVLEAMACGTPVIGSDTSAMPEVVADAGLLVAPDDVTRLADSIVRVLNHASLRENLGVRGRARASQFTWEAAVGATLASYWRALEC
jgi:glycosyltransferase involved in cell wall biosynthesis